MESPVTSRNVRGDLDDLMDDEDWALIFDNTGKLKGIFIPNGKDGDMVPEPILNLLTFFDIDLLNSEDTTVH